MTNEPTQTDVSDLTGEPAVDPLNAPVGAFEVDHQSLFGKIAGAISAEAHALANGHLTPQATGVLPSGVPDFVPPHVTDVPGDVPTMRTDGPTLAEFVEAGYQADKYPPYGYAARSAEPVERPLGPATGPEITAWLRARGK